jgi:hypothetical protein
MKREQQIKTSTGRRFVREQIKLVGLISVSWRTHVRVVSPLLKRKAQSVKISAFSFFLALSLFLTLGFEYLRFSFSARTKNHTLEQQNHSLCMSSMHTTPRSMIK